MAALMGIFQLPIVLLNTVGFIVSAIWLLIIGEWRSVVAGIAMSFFAPFLLGLALLPALIFGAPAMFLARRGVTIGLYFFSFLGSLYTAVIITVWCVGVAIYFLENASSSAFWPTLVWSYGVATSPWTYMAQREDAIPAMLAAFFAQLAFLAMMVALAIRCGASDRRANLRACDGCGSSAPHALIGRSETKWAAGSRSLDPTL
jgi:hypothetical protein